MQAYGYTSPPQTTYSLFNEIKAIKANKSSSIGIFFLTILLLLLANTVNAQAYDDFNCGTDTEINIENLTIVAEGGWGDVTHITDNGPWTVWSTNYPNLATATLSLTGSKDIKKIGLFENSIAASFGTVEVTLLNGSTILEELIINLEDAPQNNWYEISTNTNNVTKVVFTRDQASENIAELKLCGASNLATLITPSGDVTTNNPTYTWNAVSGATWYYLWVNDSTGNKIKQWYTASQANCESGTGICSVSSSISLSNGDGTWWLRTWNDTGYGPWSASLNFNVQGAPPEPAILISPAGTAASANPVYTWNAVSGSTWYYLWVDDSTGNKVQEWYSNSQAGCSSGIGTCSVTPSTSLAAGNVIWWIQTWNSSGFGEWSSSLSFDAQACTYQPNSALQSCLPWDTSGIEVNLAMYKNWRPMAVHLAPQTVVTNELGESNTGENCFDLHDRYWTKGDDGFAYHTWHPTEVEGCTFYHEHGDNPVGLFKDGPDSDPNAVARSSKAFEYGGGYPPFGYAMAVYNRTHAKIRREDHFGHKVIVANGIRMAIGNSQNPNADIYDTGIRCDWYSKIHQGSYSADALTNNMHEYFLTLICNDDADKGAIDPNADDVTRFSFKSMLNWGNPYLIKEVGGQGRVEQLDGTTVINENIWTSYIPKALQHSSINQQTTGKWLMRTEGAQEVHDTPCIVGTTTDTSEFGEVWNTVTDQTGCIAAFGPINSTLQYPWGGSDDIPTLDTGITTINGLVKDYAESGSRDFEFFSGFAYKPNWDDWKIENNELNYNYMGISAPELWSGPSGNYFKTASNSWLKFAPYYLIKNPSRMLMKEDDGNVSLQRTADLCYTDSEGTLSTTRLYNGAFCSTLPTSHDSELWKTTNFFNGTVRGLNFKAVELQNANGEESWCTSAIGEKISSGSCENPSININQKANLIDNDWSTACNSQGEHCGQIIGTIERWSIDYDTNAMQWITTRKTAKHFGGTHYKGAGIGYEWIINHGNETSVRIPN